MFKDQGISLNKEAVYKLVCYLLCVFKIRATKWCFHYRWTGDEKFLQWKCMFNSVTVTASCSLDFLFVLVFFNHIPLSAFVYPICVHQMCLLVFLDVVWHALLCEQLQSSKVGVLRSYTSLIQFGIFFLCWHFGRFSSTIASSHIHYKTYLLNLLSSKAVSLIVLNQNSIH